MSFYLVLLIVTTILVFSGLFIVKLEKIYLTETMVAMLLGIIFSPYFLNLLDFGALQNPKNFLQTATKLTIAMALMATALRLPDDYWKKFKRVQGIILSGGMILMWLSSSLITYFFFELDFQLALLIGVVITPTDPVVSASIVSGRFAEKYLPARIRHTISFESGANDGLAFPLVILSLYLLSDQPDHTLTDWILDTILWKTLAAIGIGLFSGYLIGGLLQFSYQRKYMSTKTILPFALASSLMILSFLELIHSNSIIGTFAFGVMLNRVITQQVELQEERVQESMERIFTIPIFLIFGLYAPISSWLDYGLGWLILYGIAMMLFRRIPGIFLLSPQLSKFPKKLDFLMLGWYGPIGVAAIFYSMHALHSGDYHQVWEIASFIIFLSTLIHGFSSIPLAQWYYKKTKK